MQENSQEVINFNFQLNDNKVDASGLLENTAYLYRAIIEDASGKINNTVGWNKVNTTDCQQIGIQIWLLHILSPIL
jgi:hypothetical protein